MTASGMLKTVQVKYPCMKECLMAKRIFLAFLSLAILSVAVQAASAAPVTTTATVASTPAPLEKSNRGLKKYGLYLGFIGDPFPTLWGMNLAFNGTEFVRATVGYGQIAMIKTFGFGAKFMVPKRNLSPVVGINWAKVTVKIDDSDTSDDEVDGFSASGDHVYINAGIDWTSKGGLNLGGGYNFSLKADVGGIPYINIGAFF
jgi:hypothetical protein